VRAAIFLAGRAYSGRRNHAGQFQSSVSSEKPPKRLEFFSNPDLPDWTFGPFRVEPGEGRVLRDGQPVALTPKAFELLVVLLMRQGRLVRREELLSTLWPDTFVDEANLTGTIWAIRKALGQGERWIETVPKHGYRFVGPVQEVRPDLYGKATSTDQRLASIAVLPLVNVSADPEQEYFVDGMTDALIAALAQISALKVISRTTIMRYKGTPARVPEIARELNVDGLIEGTVLRVGNRVRITVQLIHGPTDRHMWAQHYDRPLEDVLAVHRDVARAIAREIQVRLTSDERVRLARTPTSRPDAQEAYLRGRHHWRKFTEDGFCKASEYLRQAIAVDPMFAAAHVALADVHIALGASAVVCPRDAFCGGGRFHATCVGVGSRSRRRPSHVGLRTDVLLGLAGSGGGIRMRTGRRAGIRRDPLPLRALPGHPRAIRRSCRRGRARQKPRSALADDRQ
jgi:TolB-like protein